MVPGSREAPTTAIERGQRMGRKLWAAAAASLGLS
jgi:hypothetical protein